MKNLDNTNIKLAIQKEGRLTEETINFLRSAGFIFENSKQRLFSICRNFPLEILYVRVSDIPDYVASGVVDIGIVGQNVLYEERPSVKKLLNLRYGFCSLQLAVPKESKFETIEDLQGQKIATSYPNSVKAYAKKFGISLETVTIRGSVEITPALGVARAIADLVSTGSTLALNDLRSIATIYESEAVLITNKELRSKNKGEDEILRFAQNDKKILINKLLMRFKGVLSAQSYKYVMMNAPENILPKLKKIIPGLKSPTITSLAKDGWLSVQSVIKEDIFWETIERLKQIGATGIVVMPIEKLIE